MVLHALISGKLGLLWLTKIAAKCLKVAWHFFQLTHYSQVNPIDLWMSIWHTMHFLLDYWAFTRLPTTNFQLWELNILRVTGFGLEDWGKESIKYLCLFLICWHYATSACLSCINFARTRESCSSLQCSVLPVACCDGSHFHPFCCWLLR